MTGRMSPIVAILGVVIVSVVFLGDNVDGAQYYGKFLGKLSELHHGVSGEVYAVDGRTLYLKDFTYDGQGPAAYFYASTSRNADSHGFRLRDENGSPEVIRKYRREGVTLTLPEGKTLNSIKIFYVWCEEFEVNFGDVKIPRNFDYPRPQKIDPLKGVHAINSDNIVIVDAQTLLIPNLSYDGEAPDAKFWVGRGSKPSPQGIRVPDENGKEVPLRRYDRKTVVLTLPGDLTVFDIGHFGIWCEAFTVDFGHVQIPQNLNIPPSLKMLGVSPQSKLNCEVLYDDLAFEVRWAVAGDSIVLQLVAKLVARKFHRVVCLVHVDTSLNHDALSIDKFWKEIKHSRHCLTWYIVSPNDREYMSFGISGDDSRSVMIGGDVVVAWVDKTTLKGFAEDYYLDAKSQCSGPSGSCPDDRLLQNTGSTRLLNAAMVNGYSIVTYQRSLKPADQYDRQIYTNRSQPIIWAIGPLNQRNEVSFHTHYLKNDRFIDFGRAAKWNCPMPEGDQPPMRAVTQAPQKPQIKEDVVQVESTTSRTTNNSRRRGNTSRGSVRQEVQTQAPEPQQQQRIRRPNERNRGGSRTRDQVAQRGSTNVVRAVPTPAPVAKRNAWDIPAIQCYEPEDGVFYAQMGPTGGKRGYPAITGHVGWGISWYINGLLIPEINVVRGKTYTFVVEGGADPEIPAKFHPFYITDDSVGGYEHKTQEERKNIRIFAGVITAKDGSARPIGTGRLCHWTQQGDLDADDFDSFGAYQRTLELKCDQGEPGVIQWTPDRNTPDTVYYQCFTHRYLGWKINVHDSCNIQQTAQASENKPVVVEAPDTILKDQQSQKIEASPSDLEESPSIRVETRVKPNAIIISEDKEDKELSTSVSEITTSSSTRTISTTAATTTSTNAPDPIKITDQLVPQQIIIKGQPSPSMQVPSQQSEPPILVPPMQQSFYSPPQPIFMSPQGPMFVPNNLHGSYIVPSPLFYTPYGSNKPNSFRPSPVIDDATNRGQFIVKPDQFQVITLDEVTTAASSTSTDSSSTTTVLANVTTTTPQTTSTAVTSPTTTTSTTEKPPQTSSKPQQNPVRAAAALNHDLVALKPPNLPKVGLVMRRPYNGPPKFGGPMKLHHHHHMPPPPAMKMTMRHQPMFGTFKKPHYRPFPPPPPPRQQSKRPHFRLDNVPKPSSNFIILKPHLHATSTMSPVSMKFKSHVTPRIQMFSTTTSATTTSTSSTTTTTEKEPEIVTIAPSPLLSTKPQKSNLLVEAFRLHPALNTGFHPESIIVESGFKPIVTKQFEKRIAEDDFEPDVAYDIGVVDLNREPIPQTPPETFEPIFVPSPVDKIKPHKRPYLKKVIRKRAKNLHQSLDSFAEPETAAAERVESFYLPPPGQIHKLPDKISQQPSDVDLGSPPDVVVSYDGRRVSGASLTARIADRSSVLDMRASKAAELIKTRPQFAPFKGELPPLNPDFINRNLHQLQKQDSRGVISRDVDTPPPVPAVRRDTASLTRLGPVKQVLWGDESRILAEGAKQRNRRSAHHTPEHTAEQQKSTSSKSAAPKSVPLSSVQTLFVVVTSCLVLIAY